MRVVLTVGCVRNALYCWNMPRRTAAVCDSFRSVAGPLILDLLVVRCQCEIMPYRMCLDRPGALDARS